MEKGGMGGGATGYWDPRHIYKLHVRNSNTPVLQMTLPHMWTDKRQLSMKTVLKNIRDRVYSRDSLTTLKISYLPLRKGFTVCNPRIMQICHF